MNPGWAGCHGQVGAGRGGSPVGPRCPVWLVLCGGVGCHGEKHLPSWLPGAALAGSRVPSPAPSWGEGAVRVMFWGLQTHSAPQPHAQASTCPLASCCWPNALPRGSICQAWGLVETWTAQLGSRCPHSPASPWAAVGTGAHGDSQCPNRSQLIFHMLLDVGQFWEWHRVSIPAQRSLCSSRYDMWGAQHQNKRLVISRSAPGCSTGTRQDPAPPGWWAGPWKGPLSHSAVCEHSCGASGSCESPWEPHLRERSSPAILHPIGTRMWSRGMLCCPG